MRNKSYTESIPGVCRDLFNSGLQPRQSQEVHIAVLLLVMSVMAGWEVKGVQWVIMGGVAVDGVVFLVAVGEAMSVT